RNCLDDGRRPPDGGGLELGLWALGSGLSALAIELVVAADSDGQRLDRYLVSVIADYSRSQIQKLIADGHVSVRRTPARSLEARANLQVREGDQVVVDAPEAAPSAVRAEALPIEILYQDADLAVLNKPAGMVIHP